MNKFKNMKISKMLIVGFGVIIVLSSIIIISAIFSIRNVSKNTENMYKKPYKASDLMWEIRKEIISVERSLYKGIATSSDEESKAAVDSNTASAQTISNNMAELKELFTSADKKEMLAQIEDLLSEGSAVRAEVNELILANNNAEAYNVIINEYTPIFDNIVTNVLQLADVVADDAQGFVSDSQRSALTVIVVMALLLVFGIIIAVGVTAKITKAVTEPINAVMEGIQAVSEGDLSVDINYESENELGVLADCTRNTIVELRKYIKVQTYILQNIARKDMTVTVDADFKGDFLPIQEALKEILLFLNDTFHKTKDAVSQVNKASEQVADIAQNLASGATEQAAATEEITATVNVVTENVEKNAKNARNVNDISDESVTRIEEGNQCMANLLGAMGEIEAQSNEISNIIKVINDIAAQTNLLSLNASIEAARAGEHGKGFAVVAGEIGNLASESAQAAKNIANLINSSITSIQKGSTLADETAEVLKSIVSSVEETSELVGQISEASEQQAESLENILAGVSAVADSSTSNSDSAQEASASSEELLAQAQSLQELLNQYKLAERKN